MQVFLDAIYDNYIIFIAVTIFLILALIGYYVDKKTRKDSDIKPFFSMVGKNKDPNAPKKEKKKKDKKGKNEYKSVVVGGDAPQNPATTGIAQAVQPSASVTPLAPQNSTMPNPAPVSPNSFQSPLAQAQNQANVQAVTPTSVTPAMPNPAPAINPVQAVLPNNVINQTGVAPAATVSAPPVAQTINTTPAAIPNIAAPSPAAPADDDDMPMNLNMNE